VPWQELIDAFHAPTATPQASENLCECKPCARIQYKDKAIALRGRPSSTARSTWTEEQKTAPKPVVHFTLMTCEWGIGADIPADITARQTQCANGPAAACWRVQLTRRLNSPTALLRFAACPSFGLVLDEGR